MLTWRIVTAICHRFVALLNNKTGGECYICIWQKFCTLEVWSFCLKPGIEEGPLYCGPQLYQCWSSLSRVFDAPALSSWVLLHFLVLHTRALLDPPFSKASDLDWLLGVDKVTAALATYKIQAVTILSWYSEPLAKLASWTAQSLIRGFSGTNDVGGSSTLSSKFASSSFIASLFISNETVSAMSTDTIIGKVEIPSL